VSNSHTPFWQCPDNSRGGSGGRGLGRWARIGGGVQNEEFRMQNADAGADWRAGAVVGGVGAGLRKARCCAVALKSIATQRPSQWHPAAR